MRTGFWTALFAGLGTSLIAVGFVSLHAQAGSGSLAEAHAALQAGEADKALALLNSHSAPASSWSDTEPRRGRIRHSVEQILKKLDAPRQ